MDTDRSPAQRVGDVLGGLTFPADLEVPAMSTAAIVLIRGYDDDGHDAWFTYHSDGLAPTDRVGILVCQADEARHDASELYG